MDFVSHALWGGIAFGKRKRKTFFTAAGISILPDVLTEGLFGGLYLLDIGNMPGWENGHPNITAYPFWAQNFYNFSHSAIVFTLCFLLIWAFVRKPLWVAAAWGLHILIDIPTHSLDLFPTPFLWPISDYKFNGIGWHNPIVFGMNILLLLGTYSLWLKRRYGDNEARRGNPETDLRANLSDCRKTGRGTKAEGNIVFWIFTVFLTYR